MTIQVQGSFEPGFEAVAVYFSRGFLGFAYVFAGAFAGRP